MAVGDRTMERTRMVLELLAAAGREGLKTKKIAEAVGAQLPATYVLLHSLEMRRAVTSHPEKGRILRWYLPEHAPAAELESPSSREQERVAEAKIKADLVEAVRQALADSGTDLHDLRRHLNMTIYDMKAFLEGRERITIGVVARSLAFMGYELLVTTRAARTES